MIDYRFRTVNEGDHLTSYSFSALIPLALLMPLVLCSQDSTRYRVGKPIQVPVFDTAKVGYRPEISLQNALRLAEGLIKSEHIDIRPYYLLEVHMIEYGAPSGPKENVWYFWWVNENGSTGD